MCLRLRRIDRRRDDGPSVGSVDGQLEYFFRKSETKVLTTPMVVQDVLPKEIRSVSGPSMGT